MDHRRQHSVEAIRDEIIAAAAELRAVAQAEQDKQRIDVADWLDEQFIDVADPGVLLEATRAALTLYQGGMGSFQDVGTAASAHAVSLLRSALVRGLDSEVVDSSTSLMMGRQRPGEGSLPDTGSPIERRRGLARDEDLTRAVLATCPCCPDP